MAEFNVEVFMTASLGSEPPNSGGSPCHDWPVDPDWPESVVNARRDSDGNPIPTIWTEEKWERQPLSVRKRWSEFWIIDEMRFERERRIAAARPTRAPAPPYTTQAAIDWGRKQKKASGLSWVLIDRERFVKSNRPGVRDRHEDLMLGLDVLFDDGRPGMVGIQAAGRGERATHWERFCARGGVEAARRRGVRVFYWVFERGNPKPVEVEQWA